MIRTFAAAVLGLCVAAPALALEVRACKDSDPTDASMIMEPWEKNARAFYNGNVRAALIDTGGEPVCCSQHLMLLVPVHEETGDSRTCFIVNDKGDLGFSYIDFAHITSRYDAGKGLLLTIPYSLYDDGKPGKDFTAHVRVNVAKGTAAVE